MKIQRCMDNYRIRKEDCILLTEELLSEEEKNRILAKTLARIETAAEEQSACESCECKEKEAAARPQTEEGKEMKRRSRSPKRVAVLAAAAVLCFGMVCAFATGAIQVGESFRSFFGMEDGTEVEGMNKPLGIIAEDNGWKADFQEALGDSQSVYVRFDLIAPEGTVLDADSYTFIDSNINIEPATVLHQMEGYAWGFEVLETEDVKGDNRLPMMLCADYSGELAGKNMKLQMEGLRGWYPAGEGAEEGTSKEYGDFCLKTEISLDYVKKSVVKDVNAAVSLEGSQWNMNTVEISPISVILNFEADTASGEDAEKKLSAKTADDSELVLVMKDGTRRCEWRGWSSNTVGDEAFIICEASQVLHPEEIAAIEFNGETISLQ